MKNLHLSLLLFIISDLSFSQSEMSAFTATGRAGAATTFVTDYQCLGINPSNLGWAPENEKMISLGLFEGAFSVYSEALGKSELTKSLKKGNTDFTTDQKITAAKEFADAGLAANVDFQWIALGVQPSEKFGGIAFGVRERVQWYSKFGSTLSEILFLGYQASYFTDLILNNGDTIQNSPTLSDSAAALIVKGINLLPQKFSELLEGSRLSMSWYREYCLSYGRKLLGNNHLSVYSGIGVKYLTGMAIMDIKAENGTLDAFSAITPAFGIDYGDSLEAANPSNKTSGGFLPTPVGRGLGIDIGMSVIIGEKLKIGFAVNDIGSITWDGNVYEALDDPLVDMSSPGFSSYNLFAEAEKVTGDSGLFRWSGVKEKKVNLPTHIRAGASFRPSKKFETGLDIVIPANNVAGNYERAILAFGIDVSPLPWLRLSTGITTGGNYGFNLPVGLVVIVGEGTWEAGIASRDVITFFSQNRPTLSLSAGLLRFRF